jgi:hypothetical protein
MSMPTRCLLAVDLGLRTGLALYGQDGHLIWYRSHNFGSTSRLRRGIKGLLNDIPDLSWLVMEGGGPLADIWEHEATYRQIPVLQISAEDWRKLFLYPREQRNRARAKYSAVEKARKVIEWSGTPRPTSLRHDTAEAILIGLWGVLNVGWLEKVPQRIYS